MDAIRKKMQSLKAETDGLYATIKRFEDASAASNDADGILKKVKVFEGKCMNNEVTLEELDKNLRQTTKLASDNDQKLDELSRKLGVQEDELKRAIDRAELAEKKLKGVEDELKRAIDRAELAEKKLKG